MSKVKSKEEYMQDFGARVKSMREFRKYTQADLSALTGYSVPAISMIEHGKRNCNQSVIAVLAACLQIPASYLMGWTDVEGNPTFEDEIEEQLKLCTKEELFHYLEIITGLLKTK